MKLFTSDYGLYWFDYLGGYNTVFAELFGGQTDAQTLALVRGAADMQDKSWGAMIEWANRSSITLQSGTQVYNEMRQAYLDGAEYAVVFNYSPSGNGTGLLQDKQFAAIQKFWTDVVQNPKVTNNVVSQDALVCLTITVRPEKPKRHYLGFVASRQQFTTGLECHAGVSCQIRLQIRHCLRESAYPVAGRYQHVYYWNQTI